MGWDQAHDGGREGRSRLAGGKRNLASLGLFRLRNLVAQFLGELWISVERFDAARCQSEFVCRPVCFRLDTAQDSRVVGPEGNRLKFRLPWPLDRETLPDGDGLLPIAVPQGPVPDGEGDGEGGPGPELGIPAACGPHRSHHHHPPFPLFPDAFPLDVLVCGRLGRECAEADRVQVLD